MPTRESIIERMRRLAMPGRVLASLAGVSGGVLSELLNGQRQMHPSMAQRLDNVLAGLEDLIVSVRDHFGIRPDLRDVAALREALNRLAIEREEAEAAAWLASRRTASTAV